MVDTVVRLFESTATEFNNGNAALLGLGVLPDVLSAEVVEERNGEFELQMTYSVDGRRYNDLALRRLLVCKPNPFATPQAFRIYEISKPINGIVTVMAEHISYDLSGYVCGRFAVEATNVNEAFTAIEANSTPTCPFDFWSDNEVSSSLFVATPMTIRSILGGNEGSILDVFSPGEYEFDNFHVKFHSARGMDRGVTIRYGKNLTDLEQEENCSNVYTAVYPYWFSEDDGLLVLTEKSVPVSGTFDFTRIMPLDLTSEFDEKPNEAALRTAAQKYITDNKIGIPKVSLTVSFVQLAQSEEYKNYALLEEVHLCDTVTVEFPKLGVSSTAKCIKTTYNVLTGKYISIELGETKSNLSSTIAQQSETISEISPQSSVFQSAINHATKLITGGLGGYVVLHNSTGGSKPDELLVMEEEEITDPANLNVWRFNKNGLGHSSTGYNGPFGLALTYDGQIVADRITTGYMRADRIRGGTLSLGGTEATEQGGTGTYGNGSIYIYDENDVEIGHWRRTGLYVASKIAVVGSASSYFKSPFNADAASYVELSSTGFKYHTPYGEITNFYGYDNRWDGGRTFYNCALKFDVNSNDYTMLSPDGFTMTELGGDNVRREAAITVRGVSVTQRRQNNTTCSVSLDAYTGITTENTDLYVDGTASIQGNCTVVNDFRAYGYKSRVCKTDDYSERLLYCYETPSPYFGDIGEGIIGEDGLCYITVDPVFAQTITSNDYQVFLQSYGEEPVTVLRRRNGYFVVSGDQGTAFGWEIKAKQFDFDQERLDRKEDILDIDANAVDYGGEAMKHIREIKDERISA